MSGAKRVCVRQVLPPAMSVTTYELAKDKVIEHEFVIKNFKATQSELEPAVNSPNFPQDDLPQWCITVYSSGDDKEKYKFQVQLGLENARLGRTTEVFAVKFRFLNDNRSVIRAKNIAAAEVSLDQALFYDIHVDSTMAIPVSDSGDLIVNVEISLKEPEPIVVSQTSNDTRIPPSTFPPDFSTPLQSGIFSDFTIVSNDKREFPVHKLILAMRVPHFDRMFKSNMAEMEKKRVEVEFSGNCVEAMLEYVYKDSVAKLEEVVIELLQLAHQYEMDRLVSICVAEMVKNLGEENLCESLRIADLYGIIPLQSACRDFIKDHPDAAMNMILQNGANNSGA